MHSTKSVKTHLAARAFVALLFIAGTWNLAAAQEKLSPEQAKKMAELEQKYASPGEEHKRLAELEGKWDMNIELYLKRGAPPITVKGVAENKMVLGGRFLTCDAHGTTGMSMASLAILGFDRRYGKYTYVGYDSEGTYYVTASGDYDPARNALVLYGEEKDPAQNSTRKYELVVARDGQDKYIMQFFFKSPEATGGKGDFKAVEITYTRAK